MPFSNDLLWVTCIVARLQDTHIHNWVILIVSNCSSYVRCSYLAVCIETPWIFITSINQFAPVSSFRYRLIPRWFSFIHVGWPTMGQVYFDDRPITPGYQKSTEEAAFERHLGFHSTYGKQVGLGSKDASRWCIEYTYFTVCIHIIMIYYRRKFK